MSAFVAWWHRVAWTHPTPFIALYLAFYGILLSRTWDRVYRLIITFVVWVDSRPLRKWIYARRERRWLARQPRSDGSPYRDRGWPPMTGKKDSHEDKP